MEIDIEVLPHQAEFIEDITTRELALVGGYGCGKTYAAGVKLCNLAFHNAGHELIGLSPTYGMADRNLIPAIRQFLDDQSVPYTFNKSKLIFDIDVLGRSTLIRIMAAETYDRAAGLNAAAFLIDELDLIDPDTARKAWMMLSSRLRKGNVFQACATTTPEGHRFAWKHFVDDVEQKPELAKGRRIIRAKTADNPHLPPEYIPFLRSQYPHELAESYLNGEFVNLNGRTVYDQYRYEQQPNNLHTLTLADVQPNEPLHIGVDFNIDGMSAVASVVRGPNNDEVYVIDEMLGAFNTQQLVNDIKARYGNRRMIVYPDPSGIARKTSAENTDIALLSQGGLPLRVMSAHPRVRDRVNSVNALFMNGFGRSRLFINKTTCPGLHKALVTQEWDGDKPKKNVKIDLPTTKNTFVDGPVDALGYFVYMNWPIKGAAAPNLKIVGY